MPEALRLLGLAWTLAAALMLVAWIWHRRIGNAGVVDVAWALGLVAVAAFYAGAGGGHPRRAWVMAALVAIWGLRLAAYLLRDRVLGRAEDPRYAELRRRGSVAAAGAFFPFFQAQALLVVVLSAPMLIASLDAAADWRATEVGAVLLWAVALAGESVADRQLERFKARRPDTRAVCTDGLWRYSRHPNYFFEWLVWVAYALYALGSPGGAAGLVAPAIVIFLLFRVTGIPATEAQALRSRGEAYRRYQQTTSVFVPWPPGRSS